MVSNESLNKFHDQDKNQIENEASPLNRRKRKSKVFKIYIHNLLILNLSNPLFNLKVP